MSTIRLTHMYHLKSPPPGLLNHPHAGAQPGRGDLEGRPQEVPRQAQVQQCCHKVPFPLLLHWLIKHFDVVTNNTTGIFGEPLALLLTED